ncbi:MAG: hypothetical protein JOS17DRAFT_458876 [Linnemannia elongata]|nr:MAG: hypothetical protein JOS17DRAFT_458876 [Linnemannia elongata]
MPPTDVRDRRDGRDLAASRKELRDSAPRDPRERDARDGRDARDARPLPASARDLRELRDGGDSREGRNGREPRESRDIRDARDVRDLREARDARDPRDVREGREGRDARDGRVLLAPKDPREMPRDDVREGKDARDGGARPNIPRQQSSETSRVHPSRAAMLQLDTGSPSEPSNEIDRQKERERYRDDDKKAATGRETERGRDRDTVENSDRGVLREGAKDRRPQGRERVREAIKEALALETPSMASGRDRQRGDGGGRDQERRGAERRDEVTGTNRTKVSPSRRGEDRAREGREREGRASPSAESAREGHRDVPEYGRDENQDREEGRSSRGGTRQEPSTRDRDERGTSRRHEAGQEGTFLVLVSLLMTPFYLSERMLMVYCFLFFFFSLIESRKGGRESRSERRTDSSDRKRGRGSRNASPEREPKRRRDDPTAEESRVSEGLLWHCTFFDGAGGLSTHRFLFFLCFSRVRPEVPVQVVSAKLNQMVR